MIIRPLFLRKYISIVLIASAAILLILPLNACTKESNSNDSILKDSILNEDITEDNKAFYYVDKTGKLNFEDISSPQSESLFIEHNEYIFNFGISRNSNWIRLKIPSLSKNTGQLCNNLIMTLDYPGIEKIEMFIPVNENGKVSYIKIIGGWSYRKQSDGLAFLYPAFEIPQNYSPENYTYIKIQSKYSSMFRISILSHQKFDVNKQKEILVLSLITGILLAMAFYNLILYTILRKIMYLLYVLYIISMILYKAGITGLANIIGREAGYFIMSNVITLSLMTMIFWALFVYRFLEIKKKTPVLKKGYSILIVLIMATIAMVLSGNVMEGNIVAYVFGLILPLLALVSFTVSFRKGHKVSLFFIAASLLLLTTVFTFAMRGLKLIEYSTFISYAVFISAALEAMLYSFALADEIKIISIQNTGLIIREKELSNLTLTDDLTGLYNKRYFNKTIDGLIMDAHDKGRPLSMIIIDIDHFKKVNDKYGHPVGDIVLKGLGDFLKNNIRETKTTCRIGGEEFAVVFPGVDLYNAEIAAERIRKLFSEISWKSEQKEEFKCTISIGVVQLNRTEERDSFISRADKAMYGAKLSGRNRVVILFE